MGGLRSSGWLLLACAALVRADTWFFANANDSPVKYNGGDWKFEGTTIATYSEQASFQIEFKGAFFLLETSGGYGAWSFTIDGRHVDVPADPDHGQGLWGPYLMPQFDITHNIVVTKSGPGRLGFYRATAYDDIKNLKDRVLNLPGLPGATQESTQTEAPTNVPAAKQPGPPSKAAPPGTGPSAKATFSSASISLVPYSEPPSSSLAQTDPETNLLGSSSFLSNLKLPLSPPTTSASVSGILAAGKANDEQNLIKNNPIIYILAGAIGLIIASLALFLLFRRQRRKRRRALDDWAEIVPKVDPFAMDCPPTPKSAPPTYTTFVDPVQYQAPTNRATGRWSRVSDSFRSESSWRSSSHTDSVLVPPGFDRFSRFHDRVSYLSEPATEEPTPTGRPLVDRPPVSHFSSLSSLHSSGPVPDSLPPGLTSHFSSIDSSSRVPSMDSMERLQEPPDAMQSPTGRGGTKSVAFVRGVEGSVDSESSGGPRRFANSTVAPSVRTSGRAPSFTSSSDPAAQIQFGEAQ